MAVKPKLYPVLPRTPRDKTQVPGGKRAALSRIDYSRKLQSAEWYANGVLLDGHYVDVNEQEVYATDDRSFINNKDWKVKLAKGQECSAAYSREVMLKRPTFYSCFSKGGSYTSNGSGTMNGGLYYDIKDSALLKEQAVARVKNRLQGKIGNSQLAPPLAESREIGRLVRQINGIGYDALHAAIALKRTRGRSAVKLFGDIWLGFGFGINPLLKDIKSAADSILHYQTRVDQRTKVSGTANRDWASGFKTTEGVCCYALGIGFHHYSEHQQSVRVVAAVDLKTRSAASYSIGDHLGLKITQAPSVAWELTPFSWVVDYFTTVGPWLDDMFYTIPGDTTYITSTQRYHCRTRSIPYFYPLFPGFPGNGSGSDAVAKYSYMFREVLSHLPSRPLRIKSVDEIASNGISKLLNLGSVLAGHLSID